MKRFIKDRLIDALHGHGKQIITDTWTFPTRRTSVDQVEELIRSLSPRKTEVPFIRLGPPADGGYVLPDDLDGIEALFSPGIHKDSGFEKDCALKGMKVFMADKSVEGPAENHPNFSFIKTFIGCVDNDDYITLDGWVKSSLPGSRTSDLMLQMDIEGAEYETILSASSALLRRFRILIIEFHSLDELWCESFFAVASRAFEKLLQSHACVHIHPNNCCGSIEYKGIVLPRIAELTFLRRDRGLSSHYVQALPHPLDIENTSKAPIILGTPWLGQV